MTADDLHKEVVRPSPKNASRATRNRFIGIIIHANINNYPFVMTVMYQFNIIFYGNFIKQLITLLNKNLTIAN